MRKSRWPSVVGLVAVFGGCVDCRHEVLADIAAPSGPFRAVVYQRSCDGIDFSTQVSLLRAGDRAEGDGNLFGADADPPRTLSGRRASPGVTVMWYGPDTLVVRHDARVRVFRSDTSYDGVRVRYVRDSIP